VHRDRDFSGLKIMGDNLTLLGAIGARTPAAYWLAWLSEALLSAGAAADALGAVEHALGASATGLDHLYDAELYRLQALALTALAKTDPEIVTAFERSLSIARERGHALFELKTALDFADFLDKRGDASRAHALLQTALDELEGDAPIVQRAKEQRDRLSASASVTS
jgi:hypothetical protein